MEFGNKMVMSLAVKRSVALMGGIATEDKGENGFGMIEIHASCSRTLRLFVTKSVMTKLAFWCQACW